MQHVWKIWEIYTLGLSTFVSLHEWIHWLSLSIRSYHIIIQTGYKDALRFLYGYIPLRSLNNISSEIKKTEVLGRTNRLLFFGATWAAQKPTRSTILLLLRVYSLPRKRVHPAIAKQDTYIDTQTDGRDSWSTPFRCHDTYTNFRNYRLRHSKADWGGGYADTQVSRWSHKPTFISFLSEWGK
jgi:hypothetical protein